MTDSRPPSQSQGVDLQPVRADASVRPSLEAIYGAHFDDVWRYLSRSGVPSRHLEDVAQDVFMVVHRRLPDFDSERPIRPWLYGIAFRVASDHRQKKANQEVLDDELDPADTAPLAEDQLADLDRRRLVADALASLDEDRRQVFVLFELEGLSAPEIAEATNIPLNTVYSRLRIARERFTQAVHRLRERGEPS